jgi:uncharacterized protein YbjQ (UPF0145 family)
MKNIPTPYELGQEFAELQKVLAKTEGESLAAMQAHVAALAEPRLYSVDIRGQMVNEVAQKLAEASSRALDRKEKVAKDLDRVKKNAWKWYGIYL